MNDKDKMVVKNFVIAGLSLESLFACFPGFPIQNTKEEK